MDKPLVSVIMPAFNAELWIEKAIKTIEAQSYSNWELIIVNDGSSDATERICMEKASLDNRIRVYTQVNNGPSAARNTGMSKMTGNYFTIIDSDDSLREDALQQYVEVAERYQADTIIAGYKVVNLLNRSQKVYKEEKEIYFTISQNINTVEMENLINKGLMASNWNKMYRKSLADLRFREDISLNEDVLFSVNALYQSKKVVVIPEILYEYRIQNSGSVSMKFHPELVVALDALEQQLTASQKEPLKIGIILWLMDYVYVQLRTICMSKTLGRNRIEYINTMVKSKVFQKYGKWKYADTKKRKLGVILLRGHCYRLYIKLMQLGRK